MVLPNRRSTIPGTNPATTATRRLDIDCHERTPAFVVEVGQQHRGQHPEPADRIAYAVQAPRLRAASVEAADDRSQATSPPTLSMPRPSPSPSFVSPNVSADPNGWETLVEPPSDPLSRQLRPSRPSWRNGTTEMCTSHADMRLVG